MSQSAQSDHNRVQLEGVWLSELGETSVLGPKRNTYIQRLRSLCSARCAVALEVSDITVDHWYSLPRSLS